MTTSERGIEEYKKGLSEICKHSGIQMCPGCGLTPKGLDILLHQELQKAREEERERIEAIFKENVPPHAMDLEDSVWLKRLLNKAFNHDKNI